VGFSTVPSNPPRFVIVGDGSPAQEAVKFLVGAEAAISAVFTTSKESRGLVNFVESKNLPWFESETLKDIHNIPPLAFDGNWLINAFSPIILRAAVLDRFGPQALNLHNGPLPQYAGINVTQWAIRNGESDSACTIHEMTKKIDGGPIVATRTFPIGLEETGLDVFRNSMKIGAALLVDVLQMILDKKPLQSHPQSAENRRVYSMKEAKNSVLDWALDAEQVRDFIRAADYRPMQSPTYQAQWRLPGGELVQLSRAKVVTGRSGSTGEVLSIDDQGPTIICGNNAVKITAAYLGAKKLDRASWTKLL
jgi:methionyl-tRNA formyltransferase